MKMATIKKRLAKSRPMVSVTLRMPEDVVTDLKRVAPLRGFSGYQSLVRAYVGETTETIQRLLAASTHKDLRAMEREALALKTGAGTFGATRLYQQSESLELACLAGDRTRASEIVATLPRAVQATCRLLSGRYDVPV